MAAVPYILARSIKEAHDFARGELGLVHGGYRVVNTASTLKSVRGADLFLVPGWQNRFDRFAMKGAIRWTRMNVRDWETEQAQEPTGDPRGPLTDEVLDLAHAEHSVRSGLGAPGIVTDGLEPVGIQLALVTDDEAHAFLEVSNGDTMIAEGGPATPEPEESSAPTVKRRRRRCNDCGTLHFKGDPCVETEPLEGV